MKKFKIFIATVMSYLLLVSLLPIKGLETVASAKGKMPTYLKYTDLYLQSVAQYKNKSLIVSEKMDGWEDKLVLSLLKDGKEKILNDSKDIADINLVSGNGDKAQVAIQYIDNPVIEYMEYNFITDEFYQISPDLFKNNLTFKRVYESFLKEKLKEDVVKRVKEKYNITIAGEDDFDVFILNDNTRTIKFSLYIENCEYYGVCNDNFEIISKNYLEAYINKDRSISIRERIFKNDDENTFKITKVKNGNIIDNGTINIERDEYEPIEIMGDNLYLGGKLKSVFKEYIKTDGEYKYSNEYDRVLYSNIATDINNKAWFVSNSWKTCTGRISDWYKGRSRLVCKLENGSCVAKYKIPYLSEQVELYVYDDSHIMVSSKGGTIFIDENYLSDESNKIEKDDKEDNSGKKDDATSIEEDSKNKKDDSKIEKDDKEDDSGKKDDATSIEEDSKDKKDDSKIEKDDKEDNSGKKDDATSIEEDNKESIVVKNIENGKIEAILKDVQAIKDGKDVADIKLNDNVEIKLPFSVIDKSLLDGAKDVRVKLNIIKDSDIVKDRKALNKVFDFELLVDKENDEEVSVHSFANGVAEVKLTLTDEELKGLDKNNLCVFYYNEENQKLEPMETVVDGNKITFKTSHFSKYILAENVKDESNVVKENNNIVKSYLLPKTGTVLDTKIVVFTSILLILVGGSLLFIKKKEKC